MSLDSVKFKVLPTAHLTSLEGKAIGLDHNMTGGTDIRLDGVAEHNLAETGTSPERC